MTKEIKYEKEKSTIVPKYSMCIPNDWQITKPMQKKQPHGAQKIDVKSGNEPIFKVNRSDDDNHNEKLHWITYQKAI